MVEVSADDQGPDLVGTYKSILREIVDRRPSGTRRRLATALGKHRSFISQITNPSYPIPIPAQHLSAIFEVCHLSPAERVRFMAAYERAHPGRAASAERSPRELTIEVPDLGDATRNRALDEMIIDVVGRLVRYAEQAD